jgi:hypothetical protein
VLRRSMPWADGMRGGLNFVAFGKSFDAFEAQGKENGRRGGRHHRRAFQVHLADHRKLFLVSPDGGQQARFPRIGFVAIEPVRVRRP